MSLLILKKCFQYLTGILDVLEQLASLLVQAGHGEKSVSIYQCLLELNLFSPVLPGPGSYSLEDKLSLLEPVWDSGVARVGEENWEAYWEARRAVPT